MVRKFIIISSSLRTLHCFFEEYYNNVIYEHLLFITLTVGKKRYSLKQSYLIDKLFVPKINLKYRWDYSLIVYTWRVATAVQDLLEYKLYFDYRRSRLINYYKLVKKLM